MFWRRATRLRESVFRCQRLVLLLTALLAGLFRRSFPKACFEPRPRGRARRQAGGRAVGRSVGRTDGRPAWQTASPFPSRPSRTPYSQLIALPTLALIVNLHLTATERPSERRIPPSFPHLSSFSPSAMLEPPSSPPPLRNLRRPLWAVVAARLFLDSFSLSGLCIEPSELDVLPCEAQLKTT